jgi:hypothetical protein
MSKRPSTADRDPSVTDSGDGDPFLSRWARRKAAVRSGADPDAARGESSLDAEKRAAAPPVTAESMPAGDESRAQELSDEDMPALESIDDNTDMSGFFSSKVTQAVKKAALRKFFHSPAFNVVDGLDDYDDDFRNFAALGDIITSDMRSQMDREAERDREAAENTHAENTHGDSESPVAEQAREEEEGAEHQPDEIADQNAAPEQAAAAEPGVTRDPGARARYSHGKLRPRDATDEDA